MKTSGYKRKTDWVEDTSCKCSKTDEADKTACAAHEQRAVADAVSKEPDLTGEQVSYFNGIAAKIAADHYSVALLRSVNKHRLNTTLDKLMHVVDRKQIDMAGIRGQYALSAGVNSRKPAQKQTDIPSNCISEDSDGPEEEAPSTITDAFGSFDPALQKQSSAQGGGQKS